MASSFCAEIPGRVELGREQRKLMLAKDAWQGSVSVRCLGALLQSQHVPAALLSKGSLCSPPPPKEKLVWALMLLEVEWGKCLQSRAWITAPPQKQGRGGRWMKGLWGAQ